jgi:hypothetical protein
MIVKTVCSLLALAMLTGCQQPVSEPAPPEAAAETAAVTSERQEALKTQVMTLVKADEDCALPDFMEQERTAEAVDLGGGDAGVVVICSTGRADQWSRVYVSEDGGVPVHVLLPLYKYQGAEGWQTWDSMSNMGWTDERTFAGSTRMQATGCAEGASWRWDGTRLVLAEQWHMDCDAISEDGELPDPIRDFPTSPPTEQPAVIAPQV